MPDFLRHWNTVIREFFFSPRLVINLGEKNEDSVRLFKALNGRHPRWFVFRNKTRGVALLPLHEFADFDAYLRTVSGKNSAAYYSRKASREGYYFEFFDPDAFRESLREINASTGNRQGRPMDRSYTEMEIHYPKRDAHQYYGVFLEGKLRAYIWLQFAGELVLVNRILGHAGYLKDGIMYLLLVRSVEKLFEQSRGVRFMMYDTFPGASAGLRLFKKRLGFQSFRVRWRVKQC